MPSTRSTPHASPTSTTSAHENTYTLLTPLPSTEITARRSPDLDSSFTLPPSALDDSHPTSGAAPPRKKTKRPAPSFSKANATHDDDDGDDTRPRKTRTTDAPAVQPHDTPRHAGLQLPSPPTRARRIIQMKPGLATDNRSSNKHNSTSRTAASQPAGSTAADPASTTPGGTDGKRKAGSGGGRATAATRKTARKTAHSLIERRRRSRMNDEFATLQGLVPACAGAEMHKLAILQAGVEYVRYLQGCVETLKGAREAEEGGGRARLPRPPGRRAERVGGGEDAGGAADANTDGERGEDGAVLESESEEEDEYEETVASTARSLVTERSTEASSSKKGLPPPTDMVPKPRARVTRESSRAASASAREKEDHAAQTAEALLMLNTDRREWSRNRISVKDLLSHGE